MCLLYSTYKGKSKLFPLILAALEFGFLAALVYLGLTVLLSFLRITVSVP